MKAKEFKSVILFMANRWSKETAITIYGQLMGNHFYNKWVGAYGEQGTSSYRGPDHATMRLFYEMSEEYIQMLLDYMSSIGYKG